MAEKAVKKILVIDDDTLLLGMYRDKLGREGFEVLTSPSGADGLKKAKSTQPDLILLDILMPKMDGFQVLWQLKKDPQTEKIPVIFLTNLSRGDEDIQKGLELGAAAYLVKARFRPAEVIGKIREVLKLPPSASGGKS